jgi:hypothetical protein
MIVNLVLLVVFATVSACLTLGGLWGGIVMLVNVLLAATLATAWYESLAGLIKPWLTSYDYVLDIVCLWGLLAAILAALREITDRVSRTKVRFAPPVERFGAPVAAVLTAWVVVCFTAASLHVAPVPRDVIQPTPEARMLFGLAPDRRWLAWVRGSTQRGPFARPDHAFDPQADFIIRMANRRARLEAEPGLRVRPQ